MRASLVFRNFIFLIHTKFPLILNNRYYSYYAHLFRCFTLSNIYLLNDNEVCETCTKSMYFTYFLLKKILYMELFCKIFYICTHYKVTDEVYSNTRIKHLRISKSYGRYSIDSGRSMPVFNLDIELVSTEK